MICGYDYRYKPNRFQNLVNNNPYYEHRTPVLHGIRENILFFPLQGKGESDLN